MTAVGFALLCRDVRHAHGVPRCAPQQTCLVGAALSLRGTAASLDVGANEVEVHCEDRLGELPISIAIGRR